MGEDDVACLTISEVMLIGYAYLSIHDDDRRMEALGMIESIAGRTGERFDEDELLRFAIAYGRIGDRRRRAEALRLVGAMAGGRYPGSGLQ
jgi:hypothetical protein